MVFFTIKHQNRLMADENSKEIRRKAAEWGRLGEQLTREHITRLGHAVTESNWRCGSKLEIDLISLQGDEMVFIEVKTRNGKYQHAEDAIDEKKIKQLVKAANAYLKQQERPYSARFDVALIEGSPDDYEFTYIENAFIPPLTAR